MTKKELAPGDARKAFERGELRWILEKIPSPGGTSEETAALIGALSFLGRLDEAVALWHSAPSSLNDGDRALARFCLAIAHVRASSFTKARRFLRDGRADPGTSTSAETFQAFAFYFYFLGRFDRAVRWGRRALRVSLARSDDFIRFAALDLIAHSLVQLGRQSAGLKLFEGAMTAARDRGFETLAQSMRLSKLRYEAEVGRRPRTILEELQKELATLGLPDTYSRSNLVLEIARQLTLRGRWASAQELLDREAPAIYGFEDRRQEATLQLRLAEIAFRRGDGAAVVHFLRAGKRCLHRVADAVYEARLLGLEEKLHRCLWKTEPPAALRNRLQEIAHTHPNRIHVQIMARINGADDPGVSNGEDPLHDLLATLAVDREAGLAGLLEEGYLGLWSLEAGLPPNRDAVVVLADARVITVSTSGVRRSEEPWSTLPLRLLRRLARGGADKETLIREVWGHRYDPLRHDSLIYAGLGNLRRLLGAEGSWVENSDHVWRLKEGVEWRDKLEAVLSRSPPALPAPVETLWDDLNLRQIKALGEESRDVWEISTYRRIFKISTMTAWRDLEAMRGRGFLVRVGKGRATRYLRTGRFP